MSLLNDALRNLEKREGPDGGDGASIPVGLGNARPSPLWYWRWVLGVLALLLAVAAGLAFRWFGGQETASGGEGPMPALDPVPVIRTVADAPSARGPERSKAGESAPGGDEAAVGNNRATGPESVAPVVMALDPEPGPTTARTEPTPNEDVQAGGQPEPASAPEPGPETRPAEPSAPEEAKAGKEATTVREPTPAERDRQLARKLEELLADGREGEASERLRQRAMLDSEVPRSRAVMARHALVRGNPGAAVQWLPAGAVALNPELRLIRARVALAREGRSSALDWLEREPPGAARFPAYHTMMAALYQQTGDHEAAAEEWAALIETDDSNARWWAGLGIAMDAQGRSERARAAYSQALSLPDLAPQLRQYIEQRLAAEQG